MEVQIILLKIVRKKIKELQKYKKEKRVEAEAMIPELTGKKEENQQLDLEIRKKDVMKDLHLNHQVIVIVVIKEENEIKKRETTSIITDVQTATEAQTVNTKDTESERDQSEYLKI